MKTLVVYHSKFGHTRTLALEIAEALPNGSRALALESLTPADLQDIELLILGCPTHKMNLPEAVKPLIDGLPRRCLRGKSFAAFDTSYEMNAFLNRFTAGKRLDRQMRRLGGRRLAPPEIFIVEGRQGPLRAGELERARDWARSMAG